MNSISICVEGLLTQGLPVPRLQMQSCEPLLRRLRGHGEDGPPVQGGGPAVAQVHAGDMAGALHQTDQGPEDHLQSASTWVVMVLGISFLSFVSPGGYRILQEYLCSLNGIFSVSLPQTDYRCQHNTRTAPKPGRVSKNTRCPAKLKVTLMRAVDSCGKPSRSRTQKTLSKAHFTSCI